MNDYTEDIARLEAEVEARQSILADLEAEVVDLRQQISGFEKRYKRLVVPLEERLRTTKDAIRELEREHSRRGPHPLGDDNPQQDFWTPPADWVSVQEQFRRTWNPTLDPARDDDERVIRPEKPRANVLDSTETNIKKLYRALARRYHPDLATDPAERAHRNTLMAQINESYAKRDLAALQVLARQPEGAHPEQPLAALRLQELRQINTQLQDRIAALRMEKIEFERSDLLRLSVEDKLAANRGRDLLAEMALQLERDLAEAKRKLERLRRT